MNPVIICVFERDHCRQGEQCIDVVTPNEGEGEFEFDLRVEQTAAKMALRFGADAFIYTQVSKATIPVSIEEIV